MAQGTQTSGGTFWRNLFATALYKRSQGRVARQVTFAALAIAIALGAYSLSTYLLDQTAAVRFGVSGGVLALGLWISYRAVNLPKFADFLIAVEAEVNKVTWPTRSVLFRSSAVVIFLMFALALILFMYDLILSQILRLLNITG